MGAKRYFTNDEVASILEEVSLLLLEIKEGLAPGCHGLTSTSRSRSFGSMFRTMASRASMNLDLIRRQLEEEKLTVSRSA